jgi:hypothetical protein
VLTNVLLPKSGSITTVRSGLAGSVYLLIFMC